MGDCLLPPISVAASDDHPARGYVSRFALSSPGLKNSSLSSIAAIALRLVLV